MSGIFLIVWSEVNDDPDTSYESPLKTTTGGYPHITLLYSGKGTVPASELAEFGGVALGRAYNRLVRVDDVYVNSFKHEGVGKKRHDVLFQLDEDSAKWIESLRSEAREKWQGKSAKFSMHKPHISHSYHWDEESAKYTAERLKERFFAADDKDDRGFHVKFTGFTIG